MSVVPLNSLGLVPEPPGVCQPLPPGTAGGIFADLYDRALAASHAESAQADEAVKGLVTGKIENVHDVAIAVAKADLTFRLILEVRNRLTEAYQEITRIQI